MAMQDNKNRKDRRPSNRRPERQDDGLIKKTISLRRVSKTTKGGRTMGFSALVTVGDGHGRVGIGLAKAKEVPVAMERATQLAKKSMFKVATFQSTIPHATIGEFGASKVIVLPAPEGTGVIAGGAVRMVLEASGIKDIRVKSVGNNNAINAAKAIIEGLKGLRTAKEIAKLRGKTVQEVINGTPVEETNKEEVK